VKILSDLFSLLVNKVINNGPQRARPTPNKKNNKDLYRLDRHIRNLSLYKITSPRTVNQPGN